MIVTVCMIQICENMEVKLNVIGVYLPYWNNTKEQTELYIETLDMIQALIDTHCQTAPLTLMGDLNTSLPQKLLLGNKWSKVSPFNHFSAMLYDFISYNELYVANFAFGQCLNYTYHKASHVSYIDHILVSKYINKKVVNCKSCLMTLVM